MGKKIIKTTAKAVGCLLLAALLCIGLVDHFLPEQIILGSDNALPECPCLAYTEAEEVIDTGLARVSTLNCKLFGVIQLKKIQVKEYRDLALIPGGMNFGVRMLTDGVMVVGLSDITSGGKSCNPAADAGIQAKDVITAVNGKKVGSVSQLTAALEGAAGKSVTITCRRAEKTMEFQLTPVLTDDDGRYRTGLWVRDTASGIGTVTFILPETGAFGALGHGICDPDTGALTPLSRGTVTDVTVDQIIKGTAGTPGELRGFLKGEKKGSVISNTVCGVYGVFNRVDERAKTVPVANWEDVKPGKATIYCTLDGDKREEYEIEITGIDQKSQTRSFTIKVTDARLLEKTGGIVQGMSGSPIMQNGKLIGAVTHVFINDPTGGYGIFIGNMLSAMPSSLSPEQSR